MSELPDLDAMPKVMGDDGQFHATDDDVDLSDTPVEAWVALAFFWALGATAGRCPAVPGFFSATVARC